VKSGIALSDAFKAEGTLYPPILSASLIAGERSGNLEGVLRRLVQYLRLTYGLRRKAIAAAVYPMLLFGMMTRSSPS
jgi:type IV pilus assembly protein PilC